MPSCLTSLCCVHNKAAVVESYAVMPFEAFSASPGFVEAIMRRVRLYCNIVTTAPDQTEKVCLFLIRLISCILPYSRPSPTGQLAGQLVGPGQLYCTPNKANSIDGEGPR
jgi:hypothetical protein